MPRPPTEARARILAVAARQVRRVGAGATTLDAVAREAGCAKGLITYHFGGRDQLLAEAATDIFAGREATWRQALTSQSIDDVIPRIAKLVSDEATDGFWQAWVSLSAEKTTLTGQSVSNHWTKFAEMITESVAALLEEQGLEPSVPPGEFGRMIAAGFQGLGLQAFNGSTPEIVEGAHAALWAAALSLTRPVR